MTVVQWERNDWGEFEHEFGREEFLFSAKINPKSDIDDEGYITQAWFHTYWIQAIQEIDGDKWALMKPTWFALQDPLVYFRTYIDDIEARLLPHPDF